MHSRSEKLPDSGRPVGALSNEQLRLLLALTATAIGVLHATKLGLPHSLGGGGVGLSEALIRSLGIWWLWALLAPIVFYVARRWHPERVGPSKALAAHLVGATGVSMAHSLVYVPVMLALVWPEWLPQLGAVWRRNLVGNVFEDVVTYAGLAAVWYALDYRRARSRPASDAASAMDDSQAPAPTTAGEAVIWLQRISVRIGGRVKLIPVSDIEWVEASGDYTVLHCHDREYVATERIAALATALDPTVFVRVHRSVIVRTDRISELRARTHGDYDVVLKNGRTVRLSRTYREVVSATLGVRL